MLLNAAKCQGYSLYCFWVIKWKPIGGKITLSPRLKHCTREKCDSNPTKVFGREFSSLCSTLIFVAKWSTPVLPQWVQG